MSPEHSNRDRSQTMNALETVKKDSRYRHAFDVYDRASDIMRRTEKALGRVKSYKLTSASTTGVTVRNDTTRTTQDSDSQ